MQLVFHPGPLASTTHHGDCGAPGCQQDVKDWCWARDLYASRERPTCTPRAPLRTYNVGAPLERVALDILGPLPHSDRGNKYIVIIGDYFSKWTEAYEIPNQEATTVARVLVKEFVAHFGILKQIHSDKGRNLSQKFSTKCASHWVWTAPEPRPSTLSQTEWLSVLTGL